MLKNNKEVAHWDIAMQLQGGGNIILTLQQQHSKAAPTSSRKRTSKTDARQVNVTVLGGRVSPTTAA